MNVVDILSQPFMIRAMIAGLIVAVLCGTTGVFLTLKKKSFMSDGIAHGSLAGVAIGIALGIEPLFTAIIVALVMALIITYISKTSRISQDSIIGIVFTLLFALGIVILNATPGYKAEITTYLFGQILAVSIQDILLTVTVMIATLAIVLSNYSRIVYATFDNEAAYIRGIKVTQIEYIMNILIALSIVVSIKLVGIILVPALLIIPAAAAKLLASNFKQMIPISITQNILSVLIGIVLSVVLNVSPGPMIVVISSIIFFSIFFIKKNT